MSTTRRSKSRSARTSSTTRSARSQRWHPAALYSVTLGIEPARRRRLGHPLHGDAVRGHAHARLARLPGRPGLVEGAHDDVVQLRVHLGLLPEVLLEALHPLEVGDDDAARVRQYVGEDEHALVLEDLVRGRRERAVRTLADDVRLHLVG